MEQQGFVVTSHGPHIYKWYVLRLGELSFFADELAARIAAKCVEKEGFGEASVEVSELDETSPTDGVKLRCHGRSLLGFRRDSP